MANKPTLTGGTKTCKNQKKKKKTRIKLRVGLMTYMSIGWWITQQQKKLQLLSHFEATHGS